MTLVQKVAAHYRSEAVLAGAFDEDDKLAELNALADLVEALAEAAGGWPSPNKYDTAIAALAKAVGVEGEK